jgi:hypothetical protein
MVWTLSSRMSFGSFSIDAFSWIFRLSVKSFWRFLSYSSSFATCSANSSNRPHNTVVTDVAATVRKTSDPDIEAVAIFRCVPDPETGTLSRGGPVFFDKVGGRRNERVHVKSVALVFIVVSWVGSGTGGISRRVRLVAIGTGESKVIVCENEVAAASLVGGSGGGVSSSGNMYDTRAPPIISGSI